MAALREFVLASEPDDGPADEWAGPLHLDIRFCGSLDAIRALNEGRCEIAGFHTLQQPAPGSLAERMYKPLLRPGWHKIIGFAQRTQGLMVARGNPLGLQSLADLSRRRARYVNRAHGTGTRLVLDDLLAQAGLQGSKLGEGVRKGDCHLDAGTTVLIVPAPTGPAGRGVQDPSSCHSSA
jgi:molybdate-binding protein